MALIHLPQFARIEQFLALERQVSSLPRAVDFYVRGLGFSLEPISEMRHTVLDSNTQAVVRLGDERIVLCSAKNAGAAGAPRVPGFDVRFQHAAIVVSDMAAACQRLQACSPEAISLSGPQLLPPDSGGVTAFKFRDPDGNALELISFPQLPERWRQRVGASPTLGIDHAAISVADVKRSIAFYESLGFVVGARQTNRGWEQSQLDGLSVPSERSNKQAFGNEVVVDVVTLLPPTAGTLHLELLAYQRPPAQIASLDQGDTERWRDRLIWEGSAAVATLTDPDGHLLQIAKE